VIRNFGSSTTAGPVGPWSGRASSDSATKPPREPSIGSMFSILIDFHANMRIKY
jgi:hypothetical protein